MSSSRVTKGNDLRPQEVLKDGLILGNVRFNTSTTRVRIDVSRIFL